MSNARAALGQAVENLLASLPPLLRVREAGTVLRVQDSTIRYLVQCGKLRAIKATRVVLIERDEVARLLREGTLR